MNQYMVLLHSTRGDWAKFPDEEQRALLGKYEAWAAKLGKQEKLIVGSELRENYRTIKAEKGKIHVDGPFAETKEIITGYFVIRAETIEEASEAAKECPALLHGDWVQVYEMPNRKVRL
jgi:hypothetical protein